MSKGLQLKTSTDDLHSPGIIWQRDCDWGDATGHLDVWDGDNAMYRFYEECKKVYFWKF